MDPAKRLRELAWAHLRDAPHRKQGGPDEWPLLRNNFQYFEFLGIREGRREEIALHRQGWPDAWAALLLEGERLFDGSDRILVAEFGDPLHPEGVPPMHPGEGTLMYFDPDRDRTFITYGRVTLPAPRATTRPLPLEGLAELEPRVRSLAESTAIADLDVRMLVVPGQWPAILYGDVVWQVNRVDPIEDWLLESLIEDCERLIRLEPKSRESVEADRALYQRLLEPGPVFRASYGYPADRYYPILQIWLMPEAGISAFRVDASVWEFAADPDNVRMVFPFGTRDQETRKRFAQIASDAAVSLEKRHRAKILSSDPSFKSILDSIQAGTFLCWRCKAAIRRMRDLSIGRDGVASVFCNECRRPFSMPDPAHAYDPNAPTVAVRVQDGKCPHCSKTMDSFRTIRNGPGAPWYSICPHCGCSFPAPETTG